MDQLYEGERIPECKSGSFRKKEEEGKGGQLPSSVGCDQGQRGKAENPPPEVSCVPALGSYSWMRLPESQGTVPRARACGRPGGVQGG